MSGGVAVGDSGGRNEVRSHRRVTVDRDLVAPGLRETWFPFVHSLGVGRRPSFVVDVKGRDSEMPESERKTARGFVKSQDRVNGCAERTFRVGWTSVRTSFGSLVEVTRLCPR